MENSPLVVGFIVSVIALLVAHKIDKLGHRLDGLSESLREHDLRERDAVHGKFSDEPPKSL